MSTRSPRSAGGMPLTSGRKANSPPPLTRAEAKGINTEILTDPSIRTHLKHFSHFDRWAESQRTKTPSEACQDAVVLLGKLQFYNWRGVRPQLAGFLRLIALMARADGYNLRVVAETAVQIFPKPRPSPNPKSAIVKTQS